MKKVILSVLVAVPLFLPVFASALTTAEEIVLLQAEIAALQAELDQLLLQESQGLDDGDRVEALISLRVREAPSTSALIISTVSRGTQGTIMSNCPPTSTPSSAGTCAAVANGYTWWYIQWNPSGESSTFTGWSAEGSSEAQYLAEVTTSTDPLTIITTSLPNATVGIPYSASVSASGGTGSYTWSLASGSLPPGLGLISASCMTTDVTTPCQTPIGIAGTPTTGGTYSFVLQVISSEVLARREYVITVAPTTTTLIASCSVSPTTATLGQSVTWSLLPMGGTGAYTIVWSGTDGLSGNGLAMFKSYSSVGTKTGSVTVTSGAQTITQACNNSVVVSTTSTADIISPTVSITSPLNGTSVSSFISIYADAADNVGVTKVELFVDGVFKATVTQNPYAFSWLASPIGSHALMVKAYDAAGNVGQSQVVTVNVPTAITNNAQFISQSVPQTMIAGQSYSVSVTMKNIGTNNWSLIGPQDNAYRLGSENPMDNLTWGGRIELPHTVPAGGQVTINFTVKAPTTPGTYNFQWRMVQEGVQWFGDFTPNVAVVVSTTSGNDTTKPTVSITAPTNNSTVSGTSVVVSANASDNVGVFGVQFLLDGANLSAEDTISPYGITWNTTAASNGAHTLSARARDAAGNSSTSAAVTVTVNNSTASVPSCSVTGPDGSSTISGPAGTSIMTTFTTTNDADFALPWSCTGSWGSGTPVPVPGGWKQYELGLPIDIQTCTFTAQNSSGQTSTCQLQVSPTSSTFPDPAITALSPNSGPAGTAVIIMGTNFTSTGNTVYFGSTAIPNINLTENKTLGGWVLNFTVPSTATPGTYQVYVKNGTGTNSNGKTGATSNSVTFTVTGTTTNAPTVSIITPLNGTSVSGAISIYADATDNVGVTKVELFVDGLLKGTVTQNPYAFSWLASPVGSHTLTAKAYDAAGNVGQSQVVTVNVPTTITNNSQFISQSVPQTMITGQSYPVSVTMKNIGTNNWGLVGPQDNAYRLGSENPMDNLTWGGRAELPNAVPAGGQVTINFTVTAPTTSGTYNFQWRMIQEGVQWFGSLTPNVAVVVSGSTLNCSGGGYTGTNDVVGLSNGDTRFLCSNSRWYDCGWELNDPSWETKATHGQSVGSWYCNLLSSQWTKTSPPPMPPVATVHYRATLNSAPWSGAIHFISVGTNTATPWNGTLTFPADIPNAPSGITWTQTFVSGGPTGATFTNITPSATQSIITAGVDITFTFNFVGSQSLSDGSALNFASALSGMAGILERMKQLLKVSWP